MRRGALLVSLLTVFAVACEGGDPASSDGSLPPARVALAISMQAAATGGGEAEAYAKVDSIQIVILSAGSACSDVACPVLFAQTFAYEPTASETRIPINVPIEGEIQATLQTTLVSSYGPLFTGTAPLLLSPNEVATANLVLVPVAGGISVPDTLPPLVSVGSTRALRGTILFATDDTAASIHASWISLTPRIVTVVSSATTDSVVAMAPGVGQLLAFYGQYADTVGISVVQLPAAPSSFTAGFDGPLYLSWLDNSVNETEFVVERSTTSAKSGFTTSSTWGANVTYGSEAPPFPAQILYYRVKACFDFGCSPPSNVVQVIAPNPYIQGTVYLCYSPTNPASCIVYGSQTVLLGGAATDSTVSDQTYGTYYFQTTLSGGSTYTVSVRDVACQAAFRAPNPVTVTPGWGQTDTVDFYADTVLCAAPGMVARDSGAFDPVVAGLLGIGNGPNGARAGPAPR